MRYVTVAVLFWLVAPVICAQAPAAPPSAASAVAAVSTDQFQLPVPGDILPLHRGQPAPQDGLLVAEDDMLHIRQEYDRMRFLLGLMTQHDSEVCDVRVQTEQARTQAATDRLTLTNQLWTARQQELLASIQAAQHQAQQAAQREWYESPALWAAIGVVLATVVYAAVVEVR